MSSSASSSSSAAASSSLSAAGPMANDEEFVITTEELRSLNVNDIESLLDKYMSFKNSCVRQRMKNEVYKLMIRD